MRPLIPSIGTFAPRSARGSSSQRGLRTFATHFFLALALLAAQWAGQLHGLSHLSHELATAAFVKVGGEGGHGNKGNKPSLDHARDHCVVFQGLDCQAASAPVLPPLIQHGALFVVFPVAALRPAARPPFSSRAPPVFS